MVQAIEYAKIKITLEEEETFYLFVPCRRGLQPIMIGIFDDVGQGLYRGRCTLMRSVAYFDMPHMYICPHVQTCVRLLVHRCLLLT